MKAAYLETGDKAKCCGCSACEQICPKKCIVMRRDAEGFLYPVVDRELCINCGACRNACPLSVEPKRTSSFEKKMYGGYINDGAAREASSSGGAFTAIINALADHKPMIIGAAWDDILHVKHQNVIGANNVGVFRKAKYLQSDINHQYRAAKEYLDDGGYVVFSGTACQIAGLYSYLGADFDTLLTIEIICHSVPSPLFIEKERAYIEKKYRAKVSEIVFRDKRNGTWDRYRMCWKLDNGKEIKFLKDPFVVSWNTGWLSRPSCYGCRYASEQRVADITLGDLWGCSKYAPHLYGNNKGASLCCVNTEKGEQVFQKAKNSMTYDVLAYHVVARYNPRLLKPMEADNQRDDFMLKLINEPYEEIVKALPRVSYLKLILLNLIPRKWKDAISNKISH